MYEMDKRQKLGYDTLEHMLRNINLENLSRIK